MQPNVLKSVDYRCAMSKGRSMSGKTHCIMEVIIILKYSISSELISKHEIVQLLDEEMTEEERGQLEEAEAVCRRFIAWDLQAEAEDPSDIHRKLATVLGITVEETTSGDC